MTMHRSTLSAARAARRVRRARIACARAAFLALACMLIGAKIAEYRSFPAGVALSAVSLIAAAILLHKGGWMTCTAKKPAAHSRGRKSGRSRAA
nr:MAG TPA: hypothetical protein [Bacteriophage sp.]